MSNTTYVLLLCGLPGSGKSTLARRLKESNEKNRVFDEILYIEYDSVARNLQQEEEVSTEQVSFTDDSLQAWRTSRKVALQTLHEALENHVVVESNGKAFRRLLIIMDDNFHLRSMRKNVFHTCQSHAAHNDQIYFLIVWLDIPLNVCLERNQKRTNHDQRIPDKVIINMTLEIPNKQKASWEQGWIHVQDSNDISLDIILQQSRLISPPPPPPIDPQVLQQERLKTSESILCKFDGYLRTWVGAVARIRQQDAGKANAVRKSILQQLRKQQQQQDDDTVIDSTLVMELFVDQVCLSDAWTNETIVELKSAMKQSIAQS